MDALCSLERVSVDHTFLIEGGFIVLLFSLFRFAAADLLACCVCKSERIEQEQRIAIRKQNERQNKTKLECVSYLS